MIWAMQSPIERFGAFCFDRERMALTCEGRPLALGGREAALLTALLDAQGAVVSKDALMDAAWPGTIVEQANLTVQIASLRRTLAAAPGGEDWIGTVPRVGYRLARGPSSALDADDRRPAIAVLPFANLSGDPQKDYLADGLVEELITGLSRFRAFSVIARNSSFVYKNRAVDVREVARELGVRYVLEGSVRHSGVRVRVSAQLIEAATGAHLWAENFDGTSEDIFDFQDEITVGVIGLIEPEIRRAEIERARRKRPDSLGAWDLYIQALPLVYSANVPGYSDAIALLDRAIALDPDYVPALALASWAHEKRKTFNGKAPAGVDDVAISLALAHRALELDPDDPLVLALLGWLRIWFLEDYSGLALCKRAASLNPNNLLVLDFASCAHLKAGELEDVIASASRALQLGPGSPDKYVCLTHIAQAHLNLGRLDEAVAWAHRAIEANGDYVYGHMTLACANALLGRQTAARAALDRVLAIRPEMTIAQCNATPPTRYPERWAICIDGLRKAGMPER